MTEPKNKSKPILPKKAPKDAKKGGRPPKSDVTTEKRREQLPGMLRRTHNKAAIARYFGVNEKTIDLDLEHIALRNRSKAISADAWTEIGEHLDALIDYEKQAMVEFHKTANSANGKNKFLELAIRARAERIKFQMSIGQIPKATDRTREDVYIHGGVDLRNLGIEELKKREDDILSKYNISRGEKDEEQRLEQDKL